MKLNTFAKRLTIIDSTMNINVIGNFAVTPINMNPEFPNTGWWYDFFSGDSIFVSNVNDVIPLEPGEFHIYSTVKLPTPEDGILTDVELIDDELINDFYLEQNYPNPFNPSTIISFAVPKTSNVKLTVYDILGNEISVLIDEELSPGRYSADFDAVNVSSGVYFYRISAGDFIETKKMILLR
jgi:hypothetical protein